MQLGSLKNPIVAVPQPRYYPGVLSRGSHADLTMPNRPRSYGTSALLMQSASFSVASARRVAPKPATPPRSLAPWWWAAAEEALEDVKKRTPDEAKAAVLAAIKGE